MNFKKVAPSLALLVATSLLGGCTTDGAHEIQETQEATTLQDGKEEKVYVVKVQEITDHTITAVAGELTQAGPPALPDGENMTEDMPPALPDGETMTNNAPLSDRGGTQEGTLDLIGVNDILEVTFNENYTAKSVIVKNLNVGEGFGGSSTVTQGTSAHTIDTDQDITNEKYISTGDDENALRVDSAKVTLEGITVEKTQGNSSNTENGDFYGQNAGLLVTNGAEATIKNSTVNTTVTNGNGIFSYGEGTVVNVSDSIIHTTGNHSGGIQTTGGGIMNATNLEIETQGDSAAAIRSDRGGSTVNVVGGSYITNGIGSPSIYSTADISVADATLVAHNSEALVIEGKNSIALENCDVTGNMNSSKWVLTGDSYITELKGDLSQIETNGFKLFVNGQQVK